MVKLTINGREVQARQGQTVLEVALDHGIRIPALCHHPAVAPYGACRLCLVEAKFRGRTRIVTSCCYPVRDGLEVLTDTEWVRKARQGVMELLLARAPESAFLREFAASMGVTGTRYPTVTHAQRDCILCGLCVNICREVIGAAAISFVNRGVNRAVAAPFLEPSDACVGCGACAAVCPVGTIKLRWTADEVEVSPFKTRFPALRCAECDAPIAAARFVERIRERLGRCLDGPILCEACKRRRAAATLRKVSVFRPAPAAMAQG